MLSMLPQPRPFDERLKKVIEIIVGQQRPAHPVPLTERNYPVIFVVYVPGEPRAIPPRCDDKAAVATEAPRSGDRRVSAS
jgi:hypothetical protein